ncbi:MAG TPA: phosphoribosylanthranilate isomerase [Opitutales bacterium]|nr:phosphoribosylanthranilate isomerase [Opitutales bacterium]
MRPKVKVCGLTRPGDAAGAARLGADYLGAIFYEKSPRCVKADMLPELLAAMPEGRRVMVDVCPDSGAIAKRLSQGFDFFQIHFDVASTLASTIEGWAGEAGLGRLWLAPRLRPEDPLPDYVLELADTIVMDTYRPNVYGGTGETGEWERFMRLQRHLRRTRPALRLALAGGLGPGNVLAALKATNAAMVDLNSGVEDAPGQKSAEKLGKAFEAIALYHD